MFLVTTQAPLSLSTKTFSPSQFSKPKLKSLSRNPNKTLNLTVANASDSKPPSISASSPPFQSDLPVSVKVPLEGVIQFEKPSFAKQINKWGRVALFAAGDVLALLLFAGIGRFSHGFPVFDVETLHTADPFIAGWFLSAYFLGGYGSDGRGMNGSSKAIAAAAKSWVAGIPLGIIIRALSSGHIPPVNFILVTMGSTSIFLIGWRALFVTVLPSDDSKKNDVYKRGSPFELFELLMSLVRRW